MKQTIQINTTYLSESQQAGAGPVGLLVYLGQGQPI